MFTQKSEAREGVPVAAWSVAAAVVIVLITGLVLMGRRKTAISSNTVQPLASYAAFLPLSQLAMSESSSLSGGKSTFIDGKVGNTGDKIVTGIQVQVLFRNDEQMPPQIETVPLMLIRTHEPYVDTQSVSANPLQPKEEREFRLIFESLPANWNMQMPEVRVVTVETR